MRTVLDEAGSWSLESLAYTGDLQLVVVEGIRCDKPEDLEVGGKVSANLHAIEITPESRRVQVCFAGVVAWQVVDESYTTWDDSEVRDGRDFLAALSMSAYLRFVDEHHGWYRDTVGPAVHYRLWTEGEVIDVVAHSEPSVQVVAGT